MARVAEPHFRAKVGRGPPHSSPSAADDRELLAELDGRRLEVADSDSSHPGRSGNRREVGRRRGLQARERTIRRCPRSCDPPLTPKVEIAVGWVATVKF